jgi:polysaccharide pyruvyl transferase WcaK-like protein
MVLRDWAGQDDGFFDAFVQVARRVRQAGVEVRFFSFSPGDLRMRADLARAGEACSAWECGADRFDAYRSELADMDLIVTSRFHGAVFATLHETPFLAIALEPKLAQVRDWAGPGSCADVILPARIDVEATARCVIAALDDLDARRAVAEDMLSRQRQFARACERRLAAVLEGLLPG